MTYKERIKQAPDRPSLERLLIHHPNPNLISHADFPIWFELGFFSEEQYAECMSELKVEVTEGVVKLYVPDSKTNQE